MLSMDLITKKFTLMLLALALLAPVSVQQESSPSNATTTPSSSPSSQLLRYATEIHRLSERVVDRATFIAVHETEHELASLDASTLAQNLFAVRTVCKRVASVDAAFASLSDSPPSESFEVGPDAATKTQVAVLRYRRGAERPTPVGFSLDDAANSTAETLQFLDGGVPESSAFAVAVGTRSKEGEDSYVVVVVHPPNVSLFAVAVDNRAVSRFRCVDVLRSTSGNERPHDVDVYFNPSTPRLRDCAVWSAASQRWSNAGCGFAIAPLRCHCTLTGVERASVLVYEYTDVAFDAALFAAIVGGDVNKSETQVLHDAAAMVDGIADLAVTSEVFVNAYRVFGKILSLSNAVLTSNADAVGSVCRGLETIARRYATDATPIAQTFKTPVTSKASVAVVVLGFYPRSLPEDPRGFTLTVTDRKEQAAFFNSLNISKILGSNLAFACFFPSPTSLNQRRFIFAVYPVDKSVLPVAVTNRTVFRSRQIDIFAARTLSPTVDDSATQINFYFHLSPVKSYLNKRKSCVAWDSNRASWRANTCSLNATSSYALCSCNVTATAVVRVLLYEHVVLDKPRPPLKPIAARGVSAPDAVFLIVSLFSAVGFAVILVTAVFVPQWRHPAGNKALIHLTVAASLHLVMLWMRQLYDVNAPTNQRWVALHVALNYVRLAHYSWQLAMVVAMTGVWFTPEVASKVSLVAWVVPVLPLVVLAACNQREHFFWPDRLAKCVLYLAPALVIGVVNVALMASAVVRITNVFGLAKFEDAVGEVGYDKEVAIGQLATVILMFFFFGVTTVFELVYELGRKTVTVDWLFKVTAPAPGLLLCLLFVVFDSRTKALWRMLKRSAERELSGDPQRRSEVAFELTNLEGTYRGLQ